MLSLVFITKEWVFSTQILHKYILGAQNSLGVWFGYDRMVMDKDGLGDGCMSACCWCKF